MLGISSIVLGCYGQKGSKGTRFKMANEMVTVQYYVHRNVIVKNPL